jgi:hypothetical protein
MKPMSMRTAGIWLFALTLASWMIVGAEAYLDGRFDLVATATALLFTGMLVALPFLNGLRVGKAGVRHLKLCHQCGRAEAFGLKFCFYCGAFPKVRPVAA